MRTLSLAEVRRFQDRVYRSYQDSGRHDLPWRLTDDPYHIMVSEIMLQQTQVPRVVQKYHEFIAAFPTVQKLARAQLRQVLKVWSGLGYNRRAMHLQKAAQIIVNEHQGMIPQDIETLQALPGIGHATACEIAAFAYGRPNAFIETNIRTVYIHTFCPKRKKVSDKELLPLIEATLDRKNPRQWFYALMDYGVMLKKEFPNPSRRSSHHVKQSRFEGSNRQARGLILKNLARRSMDIKELRTITGLPLRRINHNIRKMQSEGLIVITGHVCRIA